MPVAHRCSVPHSTALLAAGLLLLSPRATRAESGLSYKYSDYAEDGDRIDVTTHSALLEQDFGPATHARVTGVIDTIVGASPNGQPAPPGSDQVVLAELDERREAWTADVLHQFSRISVTAGIASSRESDYDSDGWSLNTLTDFNEKNTILSAGIAGTDDDVKVLYQSDWEKKRNLDLIVGVNQLLNPLTSVVVNFSWGRATGFLNDQYKLVQKNIEVAPGVFLPFTYSENRPDERTRWSLYASLHRAFPAARGAFEGSYRFYSDTFGVDAHTLMLGWNQRLGSHVILEAAVRFYTQSEADFYYYNLDGTPIMPIGGAPNPAGPFYSSDYRLSELRTANYGLKAIWNLNDRWQFNAQLDHYEMEGTDGVTPASAYPSATIFSAGARFAW
jgi:hypothetical protein